MSIDNLECDDCGKQINFTEAYTICENNKQTEPLCFECFYIRITKKKTEQVLI